MRKAVKNGNDIYTVNSDSKLFDVEPEQNVFFVDLSFPSSTSYVDGLVGRIDTGATSTAISIGALYRIIYDYQYDIIINAADMAHAFRYPFSSVNDVNDLEGILCVLPQITIEDCVFCNFPFYLIDDAINSIALIGYDFISSCDMVQIKDDVMSFYNFDINSMWSKMRSTNALHLAQLE